MGLHTSSENFFKNLLFEKIFKLLLNLMYLDKIHKNEVRFLAVDTFHEQY